MRPDAAIGRDPDEIRRSVQVPAGEDASEMIDRVRAFAQAGFTEVIIMLSGGSMMSTSTDPVRTAEMIAEKVLPTLSQIVTRSITARTDLGLNPE